MMPKMRSIKTKRNNSKNLLSSNEYISYTMGPTLNSKYTRGHSPEKDFNRNSPHCKNMTVIGEEVYYKSQLKDLRLENINLKR